MYLQAGWPCSADGLVQMLMQMRGNWTMYLKRGEGVVDEGSRGMTLRRDWERWGRVTVLHSRGSKV